MNQWLTNDDMNLIIIALRRHQRFYKERKVKTQLNFLLYPDMNEVKDIVKECDEEITAVEALCNKFPA